MKTLLTMALLVLAMSQAAPAATESELKDFLASPLTAALSVYQKGVSPAKGTRCPMYPSDSAYCRVALHQFGFLQGMLMTFDRLNRCGHDLALYPVVMTSQGMRFYDTP
jgi:putative component of membrane protein insertase Oxa1/YidC/SpoIIIJ protein YidD